MFLSASSIEEYLTEVKVPYDCEFLVGQSLSRKGIEDFTISLKKIYQDHPSRTSKTHSVANWTSSDGLIWFQKSLLNRRGDLHDVVIRVGLPGEVNVLVL